MSPVMMKRLYYLQQKVGMTNAEATALATLVGLFILGAGVKYIGDFDAPFDESIYAEVDSLFALGVSRLQTVPAGTAESSTGGNAVSEAASSGRLVSPSVTLQETIDINTAGHADLQKLPGIGPALADRIINHRNVHGPFASVVQLTAVNGIGARTLERLRPHISVSPPPE